jgi:Tfp pilus assembly protein PilO
VDAGGAAIALALSALFYVAAVQPAMDHRQTSATQHLRVAAAEQQAAGLQLQLQAAADQLAAMRHGQSGPTLEPVAALNRRLSEIAALAAAHRLDLAAIRPGAAVPVSRYIALPISLSGTGSFRNCVEFLHDLHDRLPDVSATALNLTAVEAGAAAPMARFQLELRWYAAGAAPAAVSTSAAVASLPQ